MIHTVKSAKERFEATGERPRVFCDGTQIDDVRECKEGPDGYVEYWRTRPNDNGRPGRVMIAPETAHGDVRVEWYKPHA